MMAGKERQNHYFLILILILAFAFRFYGINWDQGFHLHPDERMIIMVAERIHLPKPLNLTSLLNSQSPLNPKFFPYGSFPIYLLKLIGNLFSFLNPIWADYQGLLYLGRFLSVLFELGTIIVIFKISCFFLPNLFNLIPSFFYSLSLLAIQNSHFYVVDVPLTFFTTLTLYFLIKLFLKPSLKGAILTGVAFGLALTSKVSASLLIVPILFALTLIFIRKRYKLQVASCTLLIFTFSFLIFILTMPYALIDFKTFSAHTLEQSKMTKDPFVFPYTLQYVNTPPYLYHLKNLVLWGMGPILGTLSIFGVIFVTGKLGLDFIKALKLGWLKFSHDRKFILPKRVLGLFVLLSFFWTYFLITGSFAVKFMRYWLPIYPLFCIFGGILLWESGAFQAKKSNIKNQKISNFGLSFYILIFAFFILLWPLAFTSIYSHPHTRVTASEWIFKNIPADANLAVEHWDDQLPLPLTGLNIRYKTEVLPLYDPDSEEKWIEINTLLAKADYIIIASNRLYVPLMKLTNCQKLPRGRCYPKTAKYYQKLFDGSLGFTKVAEFTSYPKLAIGRWALVICDDSADESFTVYDHPKIMIFKKVGNIPMFQPAQHRVLTNIDTSGICRLNRVQNRLVNFANEKGFFTTWIIKNFLDGKFKPLAL